MTPTFGGRAFLEVANLPKGENGKASKQEIIDCLNRVFAEELAKVAEESKPKKSAAPRTPPNNEIDDEWIKGIETNPLYAGLDVRRELGKCQMWAMNNRCVPTRRRFVNWLSNALDRLAPVAVNGIGQSSLSRPAPVIMKEPTGWRDWVRENSANPANAMRKWEDLDFAARQYITEQLRKEQTPAHAGH